MREYGETPRSSISWVCIYQRTVHWIQRFPELHILINEIRIRKLPSIKREAPRQHLVPKERLFNLGRSNQHQQSLKMKILKNVILVQAKNTLSPRQTISRLPLLSSNTNFEMFIQLFSSIINSFISGHSIKLVESSFNQFTVNNQFINSVKSILGNENFFEELAIYL